MLAVLCILVSDFGEGHSLEGGNVMSIEFAPELVGRPFIWRTANYGDIAVHVEKFNWNGAVAVVRIVGGEDSTPAQRYPELSDGWGFAVAGQLFKRQRGTRVNNAVRDVAGIGKVAVVTTDPSSIPADEVPVPQTKLRTGPSPRRSKRGEVTF